MKNPEAVVLQRTEFGHVNGFGSLSGEHFSLAAGMDTKTLIRNKDANHCQCPHWGYVIRGHITTIDSRGRHFSFNATELFYWPPGHHVRVDADAEIVLFSPVHKHGHGISQFIQLNKQKFSFPDS